MRTTIEQTSGFKALIEFATPHFSEIWVTSFPAHVTIGNGEGKVRIPYGEFQEFIDALIQFKQRAGIQP